MHITPFKADQDWTSLTSVGLVTGLPYVRMKSNMGTSP